MAWARYDDELVYNKKVALLRSQPGGVAPLALHVLANTWSRNQGTGGFVPDYIPEQIAGRSGDGWAARLEAVGMFDRCDGGWMIHDFDDYSDPKDDGRSAAEKKRHISEERAKAGSKGGHAKAANRQQTPSKSQALLQQTSSPDPDPDPDPVPDPEKGHVATEVSSSLPTAEDDDEAGDNCDPNDTPENRELLEQVQVIAEAIAKRRLVKEGSNVRTPRPWMATVIQNLIQEHAGGLSDLIRNYRRDTPLDMLVAKFEGEPTPYIGEYRVEAS